MHDQFVMGHLDIFSFAFTDYIGMMHLHQQQDDVHVMEYSSNIFHISHSMLFYSLPIFQEVQHVAHRLRANMFMSSINSPKQPNFISDTIVVNG